MYAKQHKARIHLFVEDGFPRIVKKGVVIKNGRVRKNATGIGWYL